MDKKDRLWIGTNDNGAVLYDNGEFQFFGKEEGLISLSVRAIAEDASGNIILATTQGVAYIDDNYELHMIEDPEIEEKFVCRLKTEQLTPGVTFLPMEYCIFRVHPVSAASILIKREIREKMSGWLFMDMRSLMRCRTRG